MSNTIDAREVNGWWGCHVCRLQFDEGTDRMVYVIEDATICQKCYNGGLLWAIKKAQEEKSLLR